MLKIFFRLSITLLSLLQGTSLMATEEPIFEALFTKDGIEYRRYPTYLVAETLVQGIANRNEAANEGFRRLFKYISGENSTKTSIAMTAPVQQKPLGQKVGQKIEMTAPVQQQQAENGWTIAFVIPANFTMNTVPHPSNQAIQIKEAPEMLMAVLRYSGRWTDQNINSHGEQLLAKLNAANVNHEGEVISAAYNAPFALPFMRRNEVMVMINNVPQN